MVGRRRRTRGIPWPALRKAPRRSWSYSTHRGRWRRRIPRDRSRSPARAIDRSQSQDGGWSRTQPPTAAARRIARRLTVHPQSASRRNQSTVPTLSPPWARPPIATNSVALGSIHQMFPDGAGARAQGPADQRGSPSCVFGLRPLYLACHLNTAPGIAQPFGSRAREAAWWLSKPRLMASTLEALRFAPQAALSVRPPSARRRETPRRLASGGRQPAGEHVDVGASGEAGEAPTSAARDDPFARPNDLLQRPEARRRDRRSTPDSGSGAVID